MRNEGISDSGIVELMEELEIQEGIVVCFGSEVKSNLSTEERSSQLKEFLIQD